jgi:hypothetical protein
MYFSFYYYKLIHNEPDGPKHVRAWLMKIMEPP